MDRQERERRKALVRNARPDTHGGWPSDRRLAIMLRDMIAGILKGMYGAEDVMWDDMASGVNGYYRDARFLMYETLDGPIVNSISWTDLKNTKIAGASVAFTVLSGSKGELFLIFPERLASHCRQDIGKVMAITGETRKEALQRFLFSLACHEVRHKVQQNNPGLVLWTCDRFFNARPFFEFFSESRIRLDWSIRSQVLDESGFGDAIIDLERYRLREQDSFIIETVALIYYKYWVGGSDEGRAMFRRILME